MAVLYVLADRRFRERAILNGLQQDWSKLDDALDVENRRRAGTDARRRQDIQAAVNALGGDLVGG